MLTPEQIEELAILSRDIQLFIKKHATYIRESAVVSDSHTYMWRYWNFIYRHMEVTAEEYEALRLREKQLWEEAIK